MTVEKKIIYHIAARGLDAELTEEEMHDLYSEISEALGGAHDKQDRQETSDIVARLASIMADGEIHSIPDLLAETGVKSGNELRECLRAAGAKCVGPRQWRLRDDAASHGTDMGRAGRRARDRGRAGQSRRGDAQNDALDARLHGIVRVRHARREIRPHCVPAPRGPSLRPDEGAAYGGMAEDARAGLAGRNITAPSRHDAERYGAQGRRSEERQLQQGQMEEEE